MYLIKTLKENINSEFGRLNLKNQINQKEEFIDLKEAYPDNLVELIKDYNQSLHYKTEMFIDHPYFSYPDLRTGLAKTIRDLVVKNSNKITRILKALKEKDPVLKEFLSDIKKLAIKEEKSFYITGGFIRDHLINKHPNDIDICTDVDYSTLAEYFKSLNYNVKETGKQFLILNVSKGELDIEIAALRSDKDNNGAVPGTIKEDAERRDFTNSALYYCITKEVLVDPNGTALRDILNVCLNFIGKAKDRIKEDPIRVLRGYRFISRGWKPTPKTLKSIRSEFDYCIKNSSSTRIMIEIEKLIKLRR